jgi:large repetitive protein
VPKFCPSAGREGNTTQFEYNNTQAHYLDKIVDPLGRTGIKNEYDQQGRLSKTLDVNGKAVEYQYDLTQSTETILDVFGKPTTFIYDDRGNILQQIDAKGGITLWTYDQDNNLLSETDADGVRTQYTYNDSGDRLSIEDGAGNITRMTYGPQGKIASIVTPTGLTVFMNYDKQGNLLSSTDADGLTTTYEYATKGKPSRQVGPDGQVTQWSYDPVGNPNRLTDSRGNTTTSSYDANGRITTARSTFDLNGQQYTLSTAYTYDAEGRIVSSTNSQGNTQSTVYNSLGQVASTTDLLGNVTQFEYDQKGQPIKVILPDNTPDNPNDNPVVRKDYDALGRVISETSPTGLVNRYVYNEVGRLVETILPDTTPDIWDDNPRTKTEYTAAGRVKARVDVFGNREEYTYDVLGQLIQVKDVLGNFTSYTYTIGGQLASIIDPRNRKTEFFYDAKARLVETRFFDGTSSKVTYDALGRVASDTNVLGQTTRYEYDTYGQLKTVINALGDRTTYEYDQRKNLVSVTDALGQTTQFVYDQYGRQVKTIYANGDQGEMTYDQYNRLTQLTDENQNATQYRYDNLSQLIEIQQANGAKTTYNFDTLGRLTQVMNANQNITTYEFDAFNRLTATILPMGQRSQTAYDRYGLQSSTTDYNGDTIQYAYDGYGRLAQKSFSDLQLDTVSYTYDGVTSQLTAVTDGRGLTRYAYDLYDRMAEVTNPDGASVSYGYDVLGNRTSLTTPTGTTYYTYNALNWLDTVEKEGQILADYDYDAVGNLVKKTLANRTVETSQYDTRNRLIQLQTQNAAGTVLSGYQYLLDGVGNRTQVVESSGRTVNYVYDALNRLTQEAIADPALGNRTIDYTFDLVGNRLSRNDSVVGLTTYLYDANDRLTQTTAGTTVTQFTYDHNGSLIQRSDGTQTTAYRWANDGENRLMGVTSINGAQTKVLEFLYDAQGTRVATIEDGERTNYLTGWALPQVLLEYDEDGNILKDYDHGLGLIRSQTAGTEAFYHTDGLGSTRPLTNANGAVTDRYNYDAYGVLLSHAGTDSNSFLFAGEQRDAATGLDYLRARYYDPNLGRFISKDPFSGFITDPMSQHDYQYAHANPITNTDPTGYMTLMDVGAAIAVAGVLSSFGWSTAYIISDPDIYAEDVYGLYGQWGMGFAQGISGGFITDLYSAATGEQVKPSNDFLWQMGFMAGTSLLMGAGFAIGAGKTTIGVGRAVWVGFTDGYGAGKGIMGLADGKWEQDDVWNLLSLLPIAGPMLGGTAKGIASMRAANRAGQGVNNTGRAIDRVARELTEVRTRVESPGGTPAPQAVPDPLPTGRDPVPTTPDAPKGCFIAGTDVLTSDGIQDIETIQVGDYVMADDPNTPGDIQARRVTQVFVHDVVTVIDLYIDGEVITTTEEHPFWVPELGWVKAKDLQVGTTLQTEDGRVVDVDGVQKRTGEFKVYNFEVEGFHSYFVSDLGVLVHNNCDPNIPPEIYNPEPEFDPDFDALKRDLASQQQMSEPGIMMAGPGSKNNTILRDAPRLASEYGGNAADWAKKSSTAYDSGNGTHVETHWYENVSTGQRVEYKTKIYP